MSTNTISAVGVHQEAIAEEVISSAAKVLLLAGLTEHQIGDLFEQASQQMRSGEAVGREHTDDSEDYFKEDDDDQSIWGIAEKFENIGPVKSLKRLGKRANTVGDIHDPVTLAKAVALTTEAAGLRKEALDWLRVEANKVGIEVVANHDQWTEIATDEQLDDEENVLFLDDYSWSGDFSWYLVSAIARALIGTGDRETLSNISEIFLDEDVAIESDIREEIEKAVATVGQYEKFFEYVQSHSGSGELAQAGFFDVFINTTGFSSGTYALERWVEGMAKRGELDRYKRSNRWRILVA